MTASAAPVLRVPFARRRAVAVDWRWVALAGIAAVYVGIRLALLWRFPPFGDESFGAKRLMKCAAVLAISSRASVRYLRGSTALAGACSSHSRTAPVKAMFSAVPMFTLTRPPATARANSSSGTPEEPCSTRGTPTASRSRAMRSWSKTALRSVMACELPTATARASTPVAVTNSRASSGSVRAPGACADSGAWPSLPPTLPSSASSHSPRPWAQSAASRVAWTFSA